MKIPAFFEGSASRDSSFHRSILSTTPGDSFAQIPSQTSFQSQVENLVGDFIRQATDWKSLAAMTAGGMAYRAGRIGVMGLGDGNVVRALSVGLGLTAEVSAFEISHRALQSVGANLVFARNGIHDGRTQGSPLHPNHSNI